MWRTGTHATPKRPMHEKTRQQFLSTLDQLHMHGAPTGAFGRCTAITKHLTSCICMVYRGGTIRASSVAAPKRLLTSVLGSPNIQVSAFQTRFRSGAAKRLSYVPIPIHRMPRGGVGQKWQQRTHRMTTDDCSAA
jgi:hypothetical protein